MVAISFPKSSTPGERPGEAQGRLINAFAAKHGDLITWRRVPGLTTYCDTGLTGPRGFLAAGSDIIAAYTNTVVRIGAAGTVTTVGGTLPGDDRVTLARNNLSPIPDIVAVCDAGAFVIGNTVAAYPDPDLPNPNSVSFLDGYFLFTIGDGRIFASDLNASSVYALSFAKAEAKPDGLTRGVVSGGLFYAFGPESLEIWSNAGTSPFPLARATVIAVGLRGRWAVAGTEAGWETGPIFVASDGTVRRMEGYTPTRISTPDVERAIASVSNGDSLEASVYTTNGNAIWCLSSPTWTWEYNASTGAWHERVSHGLTRWRGSQTVRAFGSWFVGDTLSTNLLRIDETAFGEVSAPLAMQIDSVPASDFPRRFRVPRADFDLTVGQGLISGTVNQTDPRVLVSWSDDGGATWATPLSRKLGGSGRYETRVTVLNTGWGRHHGRIWRLTISDPVHVVLRGGDMQVSGGDA